MKVLSLFGAIFLLTYITRPANADAMNAFEEAIEKLLKENGNCDKEIDCPVQWACDQGWLAMIERYKPLFAEETRALKQANEDLLNEQRRLKSENERL